MLTPSTTTATIAPSRLEGIALFLSTNARYRDLIWFSEAWSASREEPTDTVQLAVCRAFFGLRQMDRAWIRLRPLIEGVNDPSVEGLLLAAEIFIERGWPLKSRKYLDQAKGIEPDHPRLAGLSERAAQPVQHPDTLMQDDVAESDLAALLPLAEAYLATGAFLKGQSILEGLKRHHPDNERVDELLWALGGDFQATSSLAELAERWGSQSTILSDFEDDAEHTESVSLADLHRTIEEEPAETNRGFPTLFRSSSPSPELADLGEDDDVTQSLDLATRKIMLNPPPAAEGEGEAVDDGGSGDTQIMRVIQSDSGPVIGAADGPSHTSIPEQDTSFDLARYREQMGIVPPRSAVDSDFDDLEGEDDDLIIVTRRERSEFLRDDPTTSDILLDEPESIPGPGEGFADALRLEQEAEDRARQSAERDRLRAEQEREAKERAARARKAAQEAVQAAKSSRSANRGSVNTPAWLGFTSWVLAIGLTLGFAAVVLTALFLYQFLY